jgi:hypothetical protein
VPEEILPANNPAELRHNLAKLARNTHRSDTTHVSELNLWFADFPTTEWPISSTITFTYLWKRNQRWEGRNWQVSVL